MPKKLVLLYFALAFLGAAIFILFTFPTNKSEFPRSKNQLPFLPSQTTNAP